MIVSMDMLHKAAIMELVLAVRENRLVMGPGPELDALAEAGLCDGTGSIDDDVKPIVAEMAGDHYPRLPLRMPKECL